MPRELWERIKIAAIQAGFTNPSAYIQKVMLQAVSSAKKGKRDAK